MKASTLAAFAAGALALGACIAACSTTNNVGTPHSSALGESCAQSADCQGTLVCVAQTCVMGSQSSSADGGGSSSGSMGSSSGSSGGSSSGAMSSSGGSSSGGGSSGGTMPEAAPPHLGAAGDACQATAQCAAGLSCIPIPGGTGGVCDVTSYGLTPTGKTCSGECNMASDCCELPVNVTIGATTYHNCNDLTNQVIGNAMCNTLVAGDTTALGMACFYYATYCGSNCSSNWTCDSNHQCDYEGTCMSSGVSADGCPTQTRTGRGLYSLCNTSGSTSKCAPAASTTGCSVDSDCAGQAYQAFSGSVSANAICRAPTGTGTNTDCTCYNRQCFLACSQNLDCATGYTCDTGTKTCVPTGRCATDAQCTTQTGNVLAKCATATGTCSVPCTSDIECSPSGVDPSRLGAFNGSVCVSGTCQTLGCASDADCNVSGGVGNVHYFCETATPVTTTTHVSAITN